MMRLFAVAATATLAMAMDTSDQPGADLTVLHTATPVHRVNRTATGAQHAVFSGAPVAVPARAATSPAAAHPVCGLLVSAFICATV